MSPTGAGRETGAKPVGFFADVPVTSGVSERRGGLTERRGCCIGPQRWFRPNSSDPEGGNSGFCLPGRGVPLPTLQPTSLSDKDCQLKIHVVPMEYGRAHF